MRVFALVDRSYRYTKWLLKRYFVDRITNRKDKECGCEPCWAHIMHNRDLIVQNLQASQQVSYLVRRNSSENAADSDDGMGWRSEPPIAKRCTFSYVILHRIARPLNSWIPAHLGNPVWHPSTASPGWEFVLRREASSLLSLTATFAVVLAWLCFWWCEVWSLVRGLWGRVCRCEVVGEFSEEFLGECLYFLEVGLGFLE